MFAKNSYFFVFKNQILGKSIRVDHVQDYKPPKDDDRYDDLTRKLHSEGCAPKIGDPQYIRAETSVKREKSPIRRDRSPIRRDRSPARRDIKREESQRASNRDRSPRRRSRSNERKRRDSSSDRSDGKVNQGLLIKINSLSHSRWYIFSKNMGNFVRMGFLILIPFILIPVFGV